MTIGAQVTGRLTLEWANKDKALVSRGIDGYDWVERNDPRVHQVDLLDEVAAVGSVSGTPADNLMVCGDSFDVMRALLRTPEYAETYRGKVKLVYIDPPFNTGQAFEHYQDSLEHSVWLSMMRERLLLIRDLLAPDGSVWVHLDDAEMAYCKVLMDEIFGRSNFVATVVWKKIHARNNSAEHFSADHDYVLVYARVLGSFSTNRVPRTAASDGDFWNPDDDPRGEWRRSDLTASHEYSEGKYTVVGPHGDEFSPRGNRWWSLSQENFEALRGDNRLWWGKTGRTFPFRKRFRSELGGLVPTTVWSNQDVGDNREAKQHITKLLSRAAIFGTPKPERLLERVLHIATKPEDIVLDCFAGSGTTAAVAHKMGRRWVTAEVSTQTVDTFTRPRLERVVAGSDPGGITESAGWTGGGGFRVLKVGEAPVQITARKDDDGQFLTSVSYDLRSDHGRLTRGVAARLGFTLDESREGFSGRRGRAWLAVLPGAADHGVIDSLLYALDENETVTVVAPMAAPGVREYLKGASKGSELLGLSGVFLTAEGSVR